MSRIQLDTNSNPAPQVNLKELIKLRKLIHHEPELSGREKETAAKIVNYLKMYSPDEILEGLGGHGVAAIYNGKKPGPTLVLRCELDALPIHENNKFEYKSKFKSVGHLCGHDGHMAILCGTAQLLSKNPLKNGKVVLLFQPAEEIGSGAAKVIEDLQFNKLNPDYIIGMHNLPGIERNTIVLKEGVFAAASRGMIIDLIGKSSHAAEPENGLNPTLAVSEIIKEITAFSQTFESGKDFALITPIHIKVGEQAFGTSPGDAVIMLTLRSYENEVMDNIVNTIRQIVRSVSRTHGLKFKTRFTEVFPATVNDKNVFNTILKKAMSNNFQIFVTDQPFKWSEDFGYYSDEAKTVFFGIGAGKHHPALHNPDYDFPDEIITTAIQMYQSIIKAYCK